MENPEQNLEKLLWEDRKKALSAGYFLKQKISIYFPLKI